MKCIFDRVNEVRGTRRTCARICESSKSFDQSNERADDAQAGQQTGQVLEEFSVDATFKDRLRVEDCFSGNGCATTSCIPRWLIQDFLLLMECAAVLQSEMLEPRIADVDLGWIDALGTLQGSDLPLERAQLGF